MRPTRNEDAVVDLLDVILRDGVIIEADVVVTVADVPLVGISLRAAVAGMTTMTRYGFFEDWQDDRPVDDGEHRSRDAPRRTRGRWGRVERERNRWKEYQGLRASETAERSGDESVDRSDPT